MNDLEERLHMCERQFHDLVELAPDAILVADEAGRYVLVNGAACRLLGYRRDELLGKSAVDIVPAEDVPRLFAVRDRLFAQRERVHVGEWTLVRKDGVAVPVEVSAHVLENGQWQAFVRDIRERRRAEAEHERLRVAEAARAAAEEARRGAEADAALLDAIIEHSPLGLGFWDTSLRYVRVNRALATINGHTIEEHLGRTLEEVVPGVAGMAGAAMRHALEMGSPVVNQEVVGSTAACPGETRHWLASYYPVRARSGPALGVAAIVSDVTELRRLDQAYRSREHLRAILDHMVDAVVVADRDRDIVIANATAECFGIPRVDRGPPISLADMARHIPFLHDDGTPLAPEELPLARALAGETVRLSQVSLRVPGVERVRRLQISASPVRDGKGDIRFAVAVWRDVTELAELDLLKQQFIRVAAHELKTPVTVVLGFAEALRRATPGLPDRQARMVDGLLRGAARIGRIVENLLLLSRVQIDRLELVREPVALDELVERVVARAAGGAPSHRLRVRRVGPMKAGPLIIEIDRQLIEQVIAHLVDNAIRYSPGGGDVDVTVGAEPDASATVAVRDRGVGIPRDKQDRVFECFYRPHTGTPHDYGGMGIGLFLCRAIVKRHGGEIGFRSEEGRGSAFSVRLPISPGGARPPSG